MSFVCFYDMSDDFPEKDRIIRETLYTYVLPTRRAAEEGEIIGHCLEALVGIIEMDMSSPPTSCRTSATMQAHEGEQC